MTLDVLKYLKKYNINTKMKEKIQRNHLPKSVKKYLARQKAKIRRMFADKVEIDEKIRELYSRIPRYD